MSGGKVPQVDTSFTASDRLGAWKARWGINRMNYLVPAGLYAIGEPGSDAPVIVTANYKMTYDLLRRELAGRSVWLLVLETFGINVWCAAGKGSFGTEELVQRIAKSALSGVVSHRRLILPILGAPGVAAHEVKKRTGFSVAYATARASDLPEYLDNGEVTTAAMRQLSFNWYERLVLIPVEIVLVLKAVSLTAAAVYLAAVLLHGESAAATALVAYLGAVFTGIAAAPLLLPLLPGKSFAVKGALAGIIYCVALYALGGGADWSLPVTVASFLALPAISAFYTLNFTGCTTYTSRSGVKKEMRLGIPVMGSALIAALILVLAGRLI
ncbi:MAG: acetyl-CoA synthase subunit gamma [Geobacteraceae bacterium GWC2_58_44]|nr:MAG: acetyl-CoA synthase subunit gamma [Geobacteraceae bacterium GWC2_58_44]